MVKFGTGGWRAIIGEEFTKDNIQLVAKSLVLKIKEDNCENLPIVIGYDRRFLSKEAMLWAGQVIASNGIKTLLINSASPTPLVMYYVMAHKLKYGMMITASHNPSLYNGIKIFSEEGRDANEALTNELQNKMALVEQNDTTAPIKSVDSLISCGLIEFFNPINEYLDNIISKIDIEAIKKANLHIAIDPLYGVALRSLNTIFSTARCDVQMLHTEHDTLFAGKMPAPNEETMRTLQNYVADYNIDLGIATDGDADRIGLIDDKGRYINANQILCILYYYFLEYKKIQTPVVKNVATTCILDHIAHAYGQECYEVPVGFKHISAKMKETNAYIGGESSGGLTVMGHINGKDAIYASALLVETIAKTGKKLSELFEEVTNKFGDWKCIEMNITFDSERKPELLDRIYNKHELPNLKYAIDKTSYVDGVKVFFKEGGWLLLRFSGTEPLIRIFAEMPANQSDKAHELCQIVKDYYNI